MKENNKNYKILKIVSIFVIAALFVAAIILFLTYKTQVSPSTSSIPPTTIKPHPITNYTLSNLQIFNILNSHHIPNLDLFANNQGSIKMCFVNYSGAVFINPEMNGNLSTPIAPSFNKSEPFVAFTQIQEISPSNISHALSMLSEYQGYCSELKPLLEYNSTFSSTQISIDGQNGYLVKFDYLNQNALNLSSTPYIGPMPNVSYYIITVPYKNTIVKVAYWGFTGYMNVSQMEDIASEIINALSSINSTS
jgi:energy-converting hydrogenase Eha subunit A